MEVYFDLKQMKTFKQKVFEVVMKIPRGKTMSYKEVARRAGNAKAARAVGKILKTNYDPKIPCHRVIKSDGTIGGYNRGIKQKAKLLKKEGVMQSGRTITKRLTLRKLILLYSLVLLSEFL